MSGTDSPIGLYLQEIGSCLDGARKGLADVIASVGNVAACSLNDHAAARSISSMMESAVKAEVDLGRGINELFQDFFRSLRELPDNTRRDCEVFGKHGWFLDPMMLVPDVGIIVEYLQNGEIREAEEWLVRHFKKRAPEIADTLARRFPDRSRIMRSAFEAHRRGEYELSVPVFLAQADGICRDAFRVQLFKKRKGRLEITKYIAAMTADTLAHKMMYPFEQSLPLVASEAERNNSFVGLNRHQVLHGESVDYASEVNSLKCVSLLNYVEFIMELDRPKSDET